MNVCGKLSSHARSGLTHQQRNTQKTGISRGSVCDGYTHTQDDGCFENLALLKEHTHTQSHEPEIMMKPTDYSGDRGPQGASLPLDLRLRQNEGITGYRSNPNRRTITAPTSACPNKLSAALRP